MLIFLYMSLIILCGGYYLYKIFYYQKDERGEMILLQSNYSATSMMLILFTILSIFRSNILSIEKAQFLYQYSDIILVTGYFLSMTISLYINERRH